MSHITAVSGANLALLVVMLTFAGGRLGVWRRVWWLLVVLAGIWTYALLTGLEPPVLRAAIMATVVLAAVQGGRRPDYLTAAVVSAAAMVLWDPRLVDSVGFRLSFASAVTLAAIFAGVRLASWRDSAWTAVAATMLAQVATLPVVLITFGGVSVVSVAANLLCAPLVAVAFPLAFVAAVVGLVAPPVGDAVVGVAAPLAGLILRIVATLGGWDGAYVNVAVPDRVGEAVFISAVMAATVLAIMFVSRDGRRWLGRLPGRIRRSRRVPGQSETLGGEEEFPLTPSGAEGIVPSRPYSLAAQDVTLSR